MQPAYSFSDNNSGISMRLHLRWACAVQLIGLAGIPAVSLAAGVPGRVLEEVTVTAKRVEALSQADSASVGTVLAAQLENRPILRTGELLEAVPGLIVTQHSGDGKANQYFLRGFNLDHGTDFASRVDGLPVNMPTHGHGQGYSDINFLIPELVDRIEYKKGTYYAEEGNFSPAGAVDVTYARRLDQSLAVLGGGEDGYERALLAVSPKFGEGDLLIGVDYQHNDGPWDLAEGFRKFNGLLKYTHGDTEAGFSLTAMGYDGKWKSTDQIPLRAVEDGSIDRFGNINPTDGGETHRYSVSGDWWRNLGKARISALAYAIDYKLDLISDFTYFTDQAEGDQFEQFDQRKIYGGNLRYTMPFSLVGFDTELNSGIEVRHDDISPVGLYHTENRVRLQTIRQDDVVQTSYSAYVSHGIAWTSKFRTTLGLRADYFDFDVKSSLAVNSGTASDSIVSPKLTMVYEPWTDVQFFLNAGEGFHSNDARGTTITVDPTDGVTPAGRVNPLVKARGEEIGIRFKPMQDVQLAGSLWTLGLDSELLFVGDGGTTEPSRASRRTGVELSAYYTPASWLIVDADAAWSHARFTDDDPAGDRIPNALDRVASLGVAINLASGWSGGARLRYLGPGALIEDNSVRSDSTTLLNLQIGYQFTSQIKGVIEVLNAFDEKANDITYFYESRLRGEADPVSDIHFHPVEPRTLRAMVTVKF
jgi:outer membrane receptor protein involved in Fe transport